MTYQARIRDITYGGASVRADSNLNIVLKLIDAQRDTRLYIKSLSVGGVYCAIKILRAHFCCRLTFMGR